MARGLRQEDSSPSVVDIDLPRNGIPIDHGFGTLASNTMDLDVIFSASGLRHDDAIVLPCLRRA